MPNDTEPLDGVEYQEKLKHYCPRCDKICLRLALIFCELRKGIRKW